MILKRLPGNCCNLSVFGKVPTNCQTITKMWVPLECLRGHCVSRHPLVNLVTMNSQQYHELCFFELPIDSKNLFSSLPAIYHEFVSLISSNPKPYKVGDPEKCSSWLFLFVVKEGNRGSAEVTKDNSTEFTPLATQYPCMTLLPIFNF